MKKRDEIEEEEFIDDEEEFIDDDEDLLDDEEEFIDDEEEEEEVKPAKKTKKAEKAPKGGKKKMKKGAKVAIIIVSVILILVLAGGGAAYALGLFGGNATSAGAGSYTATIGATAPTGITAAKPINGKMKTGEMLLAAVDNYYAADYAANICIIGGVNTKIGPISVAQSVQSFKVRYGKGNATTSDNKAENAKYFAYSKSASQIAKMYEEYYAEGEKVKYRKFDGDLTIKSKDVETASGETESVSFVAAANWQETKSYDTIAAFIEKTATDFTKLWSYEVNKDTILNYDDEVKVSEDKSIYYFTASLDLVEATAAYLDVMKYQLGTNMGMNVEKLEFKKLELECAVYANGFFKYIIVHESYAMNLSNVPVIKELNGMVIENDCINEYSFDKDEELPYETVNGKNINYGKFDYKKITGQF